MQINNFMSLKKKNPLLLLSWIEDSILMLLLVGMVFLSFLQIMLRNFFGTGLFWVDPLVRQMLLWVTLVGAMVATRDNNHIIVDAVSRFLPPGRVKLATKLICNAFAAIVCALLTYSSFLVFHMEFRDPTGAQIMTGLPLWATLLTMPVAFSVMTFRFIRFSFLSLLYIFKGRAKP